MRNTDYTDGTKCHSERSEEFHRLHRLSFSLFTFYFSLLTCLYAGWPINRTPKIEGRVLDATTGKPIENVVVNCEWIRGRPSPGGEVRKGIANEIAVTNREGKYIIPSKTSFHFISWFSEIRIHILHPLYETKEATYFSTNNPHFAEGIYETMLGKQSYNVAEWENSTIHYDVKLLSLEERYKVTSKYIYIKGGTGLEYYSILKKFGKKFEDIKPNIEKWYLFLEKYNKHSDYENAKNRIITSEKEIREMMK